MKKYKTVEIEYSPDAEFIIVKGKKDIEPAVVELKNGMTLTVEKKFKKPLYFKDIEKYGISKIEVKGINLKRKRK